MRSGVMQIVLTVLAAAAPITVLALDIASSVFAGRVQSSAPYVDLLSNPSASSNTT